MIKINFQLKKSLSQILANIFEKINKVYILNIQVLLTNIKTMLNWITVAWVKINVNYKFDNLNDPIIETINELLKKWFEQKLDKYIEKNKDNKNPEAHLNFSIKKTDKWYDGNFNFKISNENIIYKREWFKNIIDLVNHFFDHAKEELGKK